MKIIYNYLTILTVIVLCLTGCNRVSETESDFDNVLYIEEAAVNTTKNVMVSGKDEVLDYIIQSSLALPTGKDINVAYKVDFSLVDRYNTINGTKCEPLPADNFELTSYSSVIKAGNVRSEGDTVRFKNLRTMPNKTYILPVTLESNDADVLNGSKILYYRVKKGALVVKAANITDTYLQYADPASVQNLTDLSQVTFEGLIRAHDFGGDANISTLMGIEEYFMLRFGDAAWPAEQLQFAQLASFGGKWPPADNAKRFQKNVWTHFAFTFDLISREMRIYINGKIQSRDTRPGTATTVSLISYGASYPFYIGRSLGYARGFKGDICEMRIWSVARTPAEIAASMYGEGVTTGMPGLSAWWRFDEGEGNHIYDQSGNGNDIVAGPQQDGTTVNPLRWIDVELGGNDE